MTRWWFQIFFIFTPKIGEDFQFDEHIFQMGWFNHQPDEGWEDDVLFSIWVICSVPCCPRMSAAGTLEGCDLTVR